MKKLILLLFFIYSFTSFSQDSIKIVHPSPKLSAYFSAVIPGSGQIYNHIYNKKKNYNVYWKVPVIYTSLYFAGSALINKIDLEKEIRTEYSNRVNKELVSEKWNSYDNYNLISLQKSASQSRNTLFFITGGIYLIQIIEASIDAHFTHYDISPDLSLNIHPYYTNFNFSGLTFAFNIK